jgi:uncharacterized membrane protein YeaQ/YmgE (transglycosylase-associated protein family)
MDPQNVVIWLVVGAIAGFLAGLVMQGGGFGLVGNIIVGILGAVVSGYLFPRLGVSIPLAIRSSGQSSSPPLVRSFCSSLSAWSADDAVRLEKGAAAFQRCSFLSENQWQKGRCTRGK